MSIVGLFVSMQTIMQQQTEDRYRGRVFGAFGAAATMTLVGMLLAGLLGGRLGISATMSLGAGLYIVAEVFALLPRPMAAPQSLDNVTRLVG